MGIFDGAILFSDIDGTLLENGVIPQRNIEKIEFFIKEGGRFSLATGRHYSANFDIVEAIPGVSLAVATNGGVVYNYENNTIIHQETFPKSDYHFVLDVINSGIDFGVEVYAGTKLFTLNRNEKTDEHQASQHLETNVITYDEAVKYNWNKVLYMLDSEEDYEKIIAITGITSSNCDFIKTCTYTNVIILNKCLKTLLKTLALKNFAKCLILKRVCVLQLVIILTIIQW